MLLLATATPVAAEEPSHELFLELDATVRSRRVDADLIVTARLGMQAEPEAEKLVLRLVEPLAPATKFYWVDPAGPFGEESKLAAVVTLPEGSWQALERAREDVDTIGVATHARWQAASGNDRRLDGTFAFVVIGDAAGRFELVLDGDGYPTAIHNRLTDRWLNGPFDRFVGTWPSSSAEPVEGYWFWNDGEAEPFGYEPHVYHALERALDLLRSPVPTATEPVFDDRLAEILIEVVSTLAPKARGALPSTGPTAQLTRRGGAEATVIEIAADGLAGSRVRSGGGDRIRADSVSVRWRQPGLDLSLTIGYRPRDGLSAG